jgi:hypothetical protein
MADPTMPVLMRSRRAVLLGVVAGSAAAAGLLLSGAAYAQMPNVNILPEMKSKTPEEIEQDKITDKAYKDSLRKIPDAKTSSDPWGDVRSAEPARSAAKPKSRTGNAAQ